MDPLRSRTRVSFNFLNLKIVVKYVVKLSKQLFIQIETNPWSINEDQEAYIHTQKLLALGFGFYTKIKLFGVSTQNPILKPKICFFWVLCRNPKKIGFWVKPIPKNLCVWMHVKKSSSFSRKLNKIWV